MKSNPWGQKPRPSWPSLLLRKLLMGAVLTLLAGAVVMFLWNETLPGALSSARPITFPQAVGLLLLCRLLFYSNGYPQRGRPAQTTRPILPEEDRAAFLARIRQRLAEGDKDAHD